MRYFTYILESEKDGSWYYGQTNSLADRLKRHNAGLEKYTKQKLPWRLKWYQSFDSRAEAMRLEKKLKNMKSRSRVQEFMNMNPL